MAGLIVFAVAFVLDFVWAWYTNAITQARPYMAAIYAGVIMWLTGSNNIAYVTQHELLPWAVTGAMAGTFVAVWRKR